MSLFQSDLTVAALIFTTSFKRSQQVHDLPTSVNGRVILPFARVLCSRKFTDAKNSDFTVSYRGLEKTRMHNLPQNIHYLHTQHVQIQRRGTGGPDTPPP